MLNILKSYLNSFCIQGNRGGDIVLQDYRLNVEEYQECAAQMNATAADTYRYLNFHKMPHYTHTADKVIVRKTVV
mgnify:FL=1